MFAQVTISEGDRWRLKLLRNGKFSLRADMGDARTGDGAIRQHVATGDFPADVFGALFAVAADPRFPQWVSSLEGARGFVDEASYRRKVLAHKLRAARAAAQAQRRCADFDALAASLGAEQ